MKIYLDLCCFNRPYDDQSHSRIYLETQAKVMIQSKIRQKSCDLIWSAILDFENAKNPYEDHRLAIMNWRRLATTVVLAENAVVTLARELVQYGVGEYDALHVASARVGQANLFVTTDDRLLKKLNKINLIAAMLPGNAIARLENWYDD